MRKFDLLGELIEAQKLLHCRLQVYRSFIRDIPQGFIPTAAADFKATIADGLKKRNVKVGNGGNLRFVCFQPRLKPADFLLCAFNLDADAMWRVQHPATQAELFCETIDKRTESDTLHSTTYVDSDSSQIHCVILLELRFQEDRLTLKPGEIRTCFLNGTTHGKLAITAPFITFLSSSRHESDGC